MGGATPPKAECLGIAYSVKQARSPTRRSRSRSRSG